MDKITTFFQTLYKGTVQGTQQFIDNDLHNYYPLFIVAGILLCLKLLQVIIKRIKTR